NSVNYEDGDGPGSRIAKIMPLVREHGAAVIALTIDERGQARTAEWKVEVATRLIEDLTGTWGMRTCDIIVDCLTFPIGTGQEERGGDDRGHPRRQAPLPRRADHARGLERVVRPEPGRARGAELGLSRRVRAGRARLGDRSRVADHADRPDRRGRAPDRARPD